MSHARGAPQGNDRGRRWYHLRPEPRRRTDLMGFNSTWWMAVAWVLILILAFLPFPWGVT